MRDIPFGVNKSQIRLLNLSHSTLFVSIGSRLHVSAVIANHHQGCHKRRYRKDYILHLDGDLPFHTTNKFKIIKPLKCVQNMKVRQSWKDCIYRVAQKERMFFNLPAISFFGVTSNQKSTFENLV